MRNLSVKEQGDKAYLLEHKTSGDELIMTMPLPESGGGGGGGSQPGPNTVGTDEIVDNSIMMEDLNEEVKDAMMTEDDRVTQDELADFDV